MKAIRTIIAKTAMTFENAYFAAQHNNGEWDSHGLPEDHYGYDDSI